MRFSVQLVPNLSNQSRAFRHNSCTIILPSAEGGNYTCQKVSPSKEYPNMNLLRLKRGGNQTVPRSPNRRRANRNAGGVFIEFLFSIPVFIIFIAGIIEMSKYMMLVSMSTQNAYETARFASQSPRSQGTVGLDQFGNQLMTNYSKFYDSGKSPQPVKTTHVNGAGTVVPELIDVEIRGAITERPRLVHTYFDKFNTKISGPYLLRVNNIVVDYRTPQNP